MDLTREFRAGVVVVRVSGDLDVQSADSFRRRVDAWMAEDCPHLVLNLSKVTFLDSTGLGVLLGRIRKAEATGCRLGVVPPPGVARRLLDMAALGRAVPLFRSERSAVDGEAQTHA